MGAGLDHGEVGFAEVRYKLLERYVMNQTTVSWDDEALEFYYFIFEIVYPGIR